MSDPAEPRVRRVTMRSYRYLVVGGGMTGDAVCDVELHLGRTVVSIAPASRRATDEAGDEYAYEMLVLATGGTPRRLGADDGDVVYFRTLDDYRRVRALSDAGARYYRERGVEVMPESRVEAVEGTRLRLEDGRVVDADAIVAGLGIMPRTDLAADAGVVVDDRGRVAGFDHVFAAGDVARFPIEALGRSGRVEHEDHALSHGRLVGANAAGADEAYDRLPFFYSDLFDLGYEAVGEVDARLATVEAWLEPARKGVVAFVDVASRPRGFVLWNVWDKVDAARELVRAARPVAEDDLLALAG
jgi:3-phenylpropionate/trans-cinnamate dioxygenase ferredoxin reductase component